MNGVEGVIVVPVGAPVRFTVTELVNPFLPLMDTWITKEPPGGTVAELGVADSVKSGGGGGGGPEPPPLDEPPPQEVRANDKTTEVAQSKPFAEVYRKHWRTRIIAFDQNIWSNSRNGQVGTRPC